MQVAKFNGKSNATDLTKLSSQWVTIQYLLSFKNAPHEKIVSEEHFNEFLWVLIDSTWVYKGN